MQSWKKRWFVLTRSTDAYGQSSVQLTYFADADSKEKKGTIDLSQVESVNPTPIKSKENVFSLELSDRHRQLFKSPDTATKALWVAKLLEVCSKGKQMSGGACNYHKLCTHTRSSPPPYLDLLACPFS